VIRDSKWPRCGFLLAFGCAAGVALADETRSAAGTAKAITLPGREFHEECVQLTARQQLGYSFRSPAPVEFNIHYHRDDKIHYPVHRKRVTALSGSYVPKRTDGYCLEPISIVGA
jgi:hypothetical protein